MNKVLEARLQSGLTREQAADKLRIPEKLMFALEIGADAAVCPGRHLTDDDAVELLKGVKSAKG